MNKELGKRIETSIILLIVASVCILVDKLIFGIANFFVALVCYDEWAKINYKFYYLKNKNKNKEFQYLIVKFLGLLYLFFYIWFSLLLRGDSFESGIFFTTILCICISSDIGGYIFGKTIGGKKLTKISPNKTISGSLGSFSFSLLPIFIINIQDYIDINFYLSFKNILFCLIISLTCQLGDLFISFFKRLNKVKDTGKILPGHGGLLDRVDGIIFAIPIAWVLKYLQIF